MNYTATIQFSASDALEAQRAMQFMRETFCNDDSIHEVTASLIDANFTQWLMVRNGVEQPLNPEPIMTPYQNRMRAQNILWHACQHIDVFSRGNMTPARADAEAIGIMTAILSKL